MTFLALTAYAAFLLALSAVAVSSLTWMLHTWRSPDHVRRSTFGRTIDLRDRPVRFTLLAPARHEEAVFGDTLDGLATLRYPEVEVLAIVGHDDDGTRAVAEAAAARHPGVVRVVVDHSWPKNKPKALNTALPEVTGDVVGIFDAEDEVHPDLLARVAAELEATGADVVQAGVQLMNHHSSWYSLRNVLEYYFHFRSRLHYYAEKGLVPLGGNTVFTRTDRIREIGGWDPECLAEDCDLGIRLSSQGASFAVCYDAELVTREETPDTLRSFFKQRTRWNQGFLQVLRKRDWEQLPTRRQRAFARYVLSTPFLQAATALAVPFAIATILWLQVPPALALLSFVPLIPLLATVVVEATGLAEFCRQYGRKARARDYLRLVVGTLPFQLVLAAAALRAVVREHRGQRGWEKTSHHGLHRTGAASSADVLEPAEAAAR
jgi:glycosyltransferase XagB